MNDPIKPGDRFQNGVELTTGEIMWGTIQTVKRLMPDGRPMYRAKWGKVDKIAEHWRTPPNAPAEARRSRSLQPDVGGTVAPGMTCDGCANCAPSGACMTFPQAGRPCNEFKPANAEAHGRLKAVP